MIGIVLAGGRATRLGGGDKGAFAVAGRTIVERIVTTLAQQCSIVLVNGTGTTADPALPRIMDGDLAHRGPLAGIVASLDHVATHLPDAIYAVTVPTDTPFLPLDLVARLQDRRIDDRAEIVCARSAGRDHPTVALWSVGLRQALRSALVEDGEQRLRAAMRRHALAFCEWPSEPVDPFFNVNTPADLEEAECLAALLDNRAAGQQQEERQS